MTFHNRFSTTSYVYHRDSRDACPYNHAMSAYAQRSDIKSPWDIFFQSIPRIIIFVCVASVKKQSDPRTPEGVRQTAPLSENNSHSELLKVFGRLPFVRKQSSPRTPSYISDTVPYASLFCAADTTRRGSWDRCGNAWSAGSLRGRRAF